MVAVLSFLRPETAINTYRVAIDRAGTAEESSETTVAAYGLPYGSHAHREGHRLPFILTRTGNVSEALTVQVNISEAGGDMVADTLEGSTEVEFQSGHASAELEVVTNSDDEVEEHSTVTATVEELEGEEDSTYSVSSTANSASTYVMDDDFPEMTAVLSVDSTRPSEGDEITATVTVTTSSPHKPHGNFGTAGVIVIEAVSGTASENDFEFHGANSGWFNLNEFEPVVSGGVTTAYQAQYIAPISITDDDRAEPDETFQVAMRPGSSLEDAVTLDQNSASLTITIPGEDEAPLQPNPISYAMVEVADSGSTGSTFTISWHHPEGCSGGDSSYSAYLVNAIDDRALTLIVYNRGGSPPPRRLLIGSTGPENTDMTATLSYVDLSDDRFLARIFCNRLEFAEVPLPSQVSDSVERPKPGTYSSEPPLTGLTISSGTLSPAFSKDGFLYAVLDVPYEDEQVTLTATAKLDYSVSWNPATDADLDEDGHQADLEVGYNNIYLHVKRGGVNSFTYEIIVKRTESSQQQSANTQATGQPTISGTAQVGETITADTSGISDTDGLTSVSYTYQWISNDGTADSDVQDATSSSYTLVSEDMGKTIKVEVSFSDDNGNEETLISAATAPVAARPDSPATGSPTVSGTAQVGETLTASTSGIADADGLTNVSYNYQWVRNDGSSDTDIQDETDSTYTVTPADALKTIKVRATFTDDASNEESVLSDATAQVPANWTGTVTVGNGPEGSDSTGYSVFAGGVGSITTPSFELDGVTNTVQIVAYSQAGLHLGLKKELSTPFIFHIGSARFESTDASTRDGATSYIYTWSDPNLSWSEGDSLHVALLEAAANTAAAGVPTISGTAQVGNTLTASTSGISDTDGLDQVVYSYQWVSNDGDDDSDISGATSSTYTLVDADEGQAIKVKVSFTDDAGHEETLTSAAAGEVAARPNSPATGAPTITGTAQVGETLTASTSGIVDTDGLTNVTYSYQWISNDGTSDSDISGATSSTYTPVDAHPGKTIKVRVDFTDDAGNEESLTSAATEAVEPAGTEPTDRPYGLTATVSVDDITLTWRKPDNFYGPDYHILRHRPEEGEPEPLVYVDFTGTDATTFTDTDVEPGVLYVYQVRATIDMFATLGEPSDPIEARVPERETSDTQQASNTPATGVPVISGTAQVEETLTSSTSGIADTDGLTNVSYSYQWIRNDGSSDTDIQDATGSTYSLVDVDEGQTIKVRVSFTDDAGNDETLTSAATSEVAAAPSPLTVSLESRPASHNGTDAFTFQIQFSEEFKVSYRTLRDHAFTVDGGLVTKAARQVKGSNLGWTITVEPDSNAAVRIVLPATTDCDSTGAICTEDGRKLSNSLDFTISGPN